MSTAVNIDAKLCPPRDWKEFLEEVLPAQGEWSEEQYLVLTDHTNRLLEYTDGFLEELPMPTDKHQAILEFMFLTIRQFLIPRNGKARFAPLRLRIRPGKFREPDVVALLSKDDARRQNRFWTGADLTVEIVSPEKPERDLVDKRADYAEAHIPEYWIVNPQTETITVLRLEGDAYVEAGVFRRGEMATAVSLAGFAVDVAEVFDAD